MNISKKISLTKMKNIETVSNYSREQLQNIKIDRPKNADGSNSRHLRTGCNIESKPSYFEKDMAFIAPFFHWRRNYLKGARFIPDLVIKHLIAEAGNVCVAESKTKRLDSKILLSKSTVQERRIQNSIKGGGLGGRKTKRTKESTRTRTDPFNLLSGID